METMKQVAAADPNTPTGLVRSRDAFLRNLPTLLANPKYDRWSVAYCGDEQVAIAESEIEVVRECQRRGLHPEQYYIGGIFPHCDEEVEEIDSGLHEREEDEEIKGALSFVEFDDGDGTFSGPSLDDVRPTP
jgi:hypothetical protein